MNRQKIRAAILTLSFLLMSVTFVYLSPLFMITGLMQGFISAALLFWIAAFLLSFLFGRAFCGYLCPMGAEQELIDTAVKVPLRRVPHLRWLKYLAAVLWAGGAFLLAAGAGSLAFNPLYGIGNGIPPWSPSVYMALYSMTIGVFALVLILGKRGMCNYLCPMSAIFMAITRIRARLRLPSLHPEFSPEQCEGCGRCETVCPMSLPVKKMVKEGCMNPECIVCGNCAATCRKGAVRLVWIWARKPGS